MKRLGDDLGISESSKDLPVDTQQPLLKDWPSGLYLVWFGFVFFSLVSHIIHRRRENTKLYGVF